MITTLGKVAERVEAYADESWDEIVPVNRMRFHSIESIRIEDDVHIIQPTAQSQIANRLNIPITYLKRCEQELQAENLNRWLRRERNEELFIRFHDGEVRAVFTKRYIPVDNHTVIHRLLELYGMDTQAQVHLDSGFMSLGIFDEELFDANGLNDKLAPGISFGNSEVGLAPLSVSAFFFRLVCTNGMVARSEVSSSKRHISLTLLNDLPMLIEKVREDAVNHQKLFVIANNQIVQDPQSTMERLNRQFLLDSTERVAVSWGFDHEPGSTMYHVVNGYTRAPQYPGLPAISMNRLERVGGFVLQMVH